MAADFGTAIIVADALPSAAQNGEERHRGGSPPCANQNR